MSDTDIKINALTKSYGEKVVLNDLCAVFEGGKVSCVSAMSGKGKTTLLRLIMGLEKPDSGTIVLPEGTKISVVFQEDRLLDGTDASSNIRLVNKKLSAGTVADALTGVGLDPNEKQPVGEYSGGMKRRVAIVRALLADFDLLLLDEPFKGLDADTRARTADFIRRHTVGKTVILVTHDPTDAELLGTAATVQI